MTRPVDDAMARDRVDKEYVRASWIEDVAAVSAGAPEPFYLTLCGRAGVEIELLIERGILRRAENGAILEADVQKVVAVESSPGAVLALQERYPGLKIVDRSIHDVLRSPNFLTWPEGDHRKFCRAKVVNLDFNQSLTGSIEAEQAIFRDLEIINKLARLHGMDPPRSWLLFVTFNADIDWPIAVIQAVLSFMRENFELEPSFRAQCQDVLGDRIVGAIDDDDAVAVSGLTGEDRQALLMAFVPKKIAHLTHAHGWLVQTRRNLRYGGGDHAHMVTWALSFEWDSRATTRPLEVYRDSLRSILGNAAHLQTDGTLVASA